MEIYLVKRYLTKEFNNLNFFEKILHCIENTYLTTNVEEWDSAKGDTHAHICRMLSNRNEGLVLILIHGVFKLGMLSPIFILGKAHIIYIGKST